MKCRLKIKLAKFSEFYWWMENGELRYTHIASLMWVRMIRGKAGAITLILGPLKVSLYFAWEPGRWVGEAAPRRDRE